MTSDIGSIIELPIGLRSKGMGIVRYDLPCFGGTAVFRNRGMEKRSDDALDYNGVYRRGGLNGGCRPRYPVSMECGREVLRVVAGNRYEFLNSLVPGRFSI